LCSKSAAGGKVEIEANKVSMADLEVGADVDLEAARGNVVVDAVMGTAE
jgi:hypothetical protein